MTIVLADVVAGVVLVTDVAAIIIFIDGGIH